MFTIPLMHNKNKTSNIKNSEAKPSRLKRFLNHPLAIPFFIFLTFFIYFVTTNYWPRPLADGFRFVGREYNSGCLITPVISIGLYCTGSAYAYLYYATNISPEDAHKAFPGWEINKEKTRTQYGHNSVVVLENSSNEGNKYLYYTDEKPLFGGLTPLIPSNEKYIVKIYESHSYIQE